MAQPAAGPDRDRSLLVELRRRLAARGFFRPQPAGYGLRVGRAGLGFAICFVVGLGGGAGAAVLAACGAAFFAVQLGIVSHEAGHRSLSRRIWVNDLFGHLGMTLVNGLGFSHWRDAHDRHHRHSQIDGADPDMRFSVVLSVSTRDAATRSATVARVQRFQAVYFWLLSPFFAWSLRFDSAVTAVRGSVPGAAIDRVVLPAHYALWLLGPAMLASPGRALTFYLIYSTALSLYITGLFATNHLGLRVIEGRRSYLRQQIEHSRNIRVPRWLDFVFGGLNFHVEHHLFPRVPGHQLRSGSEVIRAFCQQHAIEYPSHSFGQALGQIYRHLAGVARALPSARHAPITRSSDSAAQ
jgi:fatty acid desaturase